MSLGERFSRIFENPYDTPKIQGVELNVELVPERRSARLETARTDVTEARPGDDIIVETVLAYRGETHRTADTHQDSDLDSARHLRILVSDGETLDRCAAFPPGGPQARPRHDHRAAEQGALQHRVYVSLLEANPQAMVEDKVMPTLPLSVMNVMDGMRGTQDMIVVGESAVNEAVDAGRLRGDRLAGDHGEREIIFEFRFLSC